MLRLLGNTIKAVCLVILLYCVVYFVGLGFASAGQLVGGTLHGRLAASIYKTGNGLIPANQIYDSKFYPKGLFSKYKDVVLVENRTDYDWVRPRIESGQRVILAEVMLLPAGARVSFRGCLRGHTFLAYAVSETGKLVVCTRRLDIGD